MLERFNLYIDRVPVLAYNGSAYDYKLIIEHLVTILKLHKKDPMNFIIKKGTKYLAILTKEFRFLDLMNYLSPNTSFDSFLKCYNDLGEKKLYFCYEALKKYSDLDNIGPPKYSDFYSELKRKNCFDSHEQYRDFLSVWRNEKMHTLKDLLTYYVKGDTEPAVNAIKNLQEFYLKKRISIFKDAVTLPGVAKLLMFQDVKEPILIFSKQEQDIYYIIKKAIVGGPSIIFTREAVCGVTPIRNNPQEITSAIKGYDLNSLYPSALIEPVPIGQYVIRRAEEEFKPTYREHFLDMYAWMDMLSETEGITIQHKMNGHRDPQVYNYRADGYDPNNHSCFFL